MKARRRRLLINTSLKSGKVFEKKLEELFNNKQISQTNQEQLLQLKNLLLINKPSLKWAKVFEFLDKHRQFHVGNKTSRVQKLVCFDASL